VSEQLRVAYDMTFPNRNAGGSGVYATELLSELRRRDDVAVRVVALDGASGWSRTVPWLVGGAQRAAADAQVMHCPALVAPWRLRAPLVLTIHDVSTWRYPQGHRLEWQAYARWLLPARARSAAAVITGTQYTKKEIVDSLGVRPERIAVTPYGVPARYLSATPAARPVGDPPLVLFPSPPIQRKNLELVLQAMAQAPRDSALSRARLSITGARADGFPEQVKRVKVLGLENRVQWRGKVPADDMPGVFAAADLVVYPSFHEGFGFPALEAMATGTPVVASNAACLPEVLGDAALLVDPLSPGGLIAAAESALTDQKKRCELIERGRARAAQFTWERCANLTVDVYRQAIAQT